MVTEYAAILLTLITILLGVIVTGGWNLVSFIKGQLVDNTNEHKVFYTNVLRSTETSNIVDKHTKEIKTLKTKVGEHDVEINDLKKYKYRKINDDGK